MTCETEIKQIVDDLFDLMPYLMEIILFALMYYQLFFCILNYVAQ